MCYVCRIGFYTLELLVLCDEEKYLQIDRPLTFTKLCNPLIPPPNPIRPPPTPAQNEIMPTPPVVWVDCSAGFPSPSWGDHKFCTIPLSKVGLIYYLYGATYVLCVWWSLRIIFMVQLTYYLYGGAYVLSFEKVHRRLLREYNT